jgi:hypothetical protein
MIRRSSFFNSKWIVVKVTQILSVSYKICRGQNEVAEPIVDNFNLTDEKHLFPALAFLSKTNI